MQRLMLVGSAAFCLALSTGLVVASAQERSRDAAPAAGPTARVAAMFGKQCTPCHTVPNLELRTDRAWLKQVSDTA